MMKKAWAFLDKRKLDEHRQGRLEGSTKKIGWETLLNKADAPFKKLPDKDKEG